MDVGVDLIEVERVRDVLARHGERFLARVYTAAERTACSDSVERLAARFAAKEAVAKALGTGIGDIGWRDIEVGGDARGRPIVTLHGPAAVRAADVGLTQLALSLSHTREHAIAFVVAT